MRHILLHYINCKIRFFFSLCDTLGRYLLNKKHYIFGSQIMRKTTLDIGIQFRFKIWYCFDLIKYLAKVISRFLNWIGEYKLTLVSYCEHIEFCLSLNNNSRIFHTIFKYCTEIVFSFRQQRKNCTLTFLHSLIWKTNLHDVTDIFSLFSVLLA